MKSLHRPDLFAWSAFDTARNVDFTGHAWVRERGNVLFDPMPMSEHDFAHLDRLGGAAWIFLSNADHVRDAAGLSARFGATVCAPAAERGAADYAGLSDVDWLDGDGEHEPTGVRCVGLKGSKTAGELAFLLPGGDTLIVGDLVRGQRAGALNLLPDAKLKDKAAAVASVAALADLGASAVLVGDGQSVFRDGSARLQELVASLKPLSVGPEEVLEYWFGQGLDPAQGCTQEELQRWFMGGAAVDAEIVERFGAVLDAAGRGELDPWCETVAGRAALVIVLDQFTRNVHRGTPAAFGNDARAREHAKVLLADPEFGTLSPAVRAFMVLPLEHHEDMSSQDSAVETAAGLAAELEASGHPFAGMAARFVESARGHREIVARWGRYPHRNEILGRPSTEAEVAWLEESGANFGQTAKG